MSDLGLKLSEVWNQPDRLSAEGKQGRPESMSKPLPCLFFLLTCAFPVWQHATCLEFGD
jgi:hypothetical protein